MKQKYILNIYNDFILFYFMVVVVEGREGV